MPLLHIALQEGFERDRVVIRVAGRVVFEKDDVRTRTQIGYADSVEVELPAGTAPVRVVVGARQPPVAGQPIPPATLDVLVGLTGPSFLLVSLGPEGLVHRVTDQPPRYA